VKPADRYARLAERKVSRETGAEKSALFLFWNKRFKKNFVYCIIFKKNKGYDKKRN